MGESIDFRTVCKGMRCRVVCVGAECPCACRLMEMGLTPGTEFVVTRVAPLGDPIEIDVRGARVCLRRNESKEILIEKVG